MFSQLDLSDCCLQEGVTSQAFTLPSADKPLVVHPAQMQRIAIGKDIDSHVLCQHPPDLLCFSAQETSAGQGGGGGKIGKK